MPAEVAAVAHRPPTSRSAVSNRSRVLPGVDGRSSQGRRYVDLVMAYSDELGGEAALTEPQKAMVRHAAALTIEAERIQSAIVRGEPVDTEQLVRISNVLSRALRGLGIKSRAHNPVPDLASYLAGKEGAAA